MKQAKMKRSLALLLAVVMCIGLLPVGALAARVDTGEVATDAPGAAEDAALAVLPDGSSDGDSTATGTGKWKLQAWGGNVDLEAQEGWLTPAESRDGFTVDFGQINQDNAPNYKSVVVYDSAAENYSDSTLEFDLTMTERQEGTSTFQVAILPRFEDGKNCDGLGLAEGTGLQHCYQGDGGSSQVSTSYEVSGRDQGGGFVKDFTGTEVWLRIKKVGSVYTVSYSADGENFTEAKTIDTAFADITQKDIYSSSPIYWGGSNHGASMMSWQHQNNINTMVEQFFTNQLPQRYLMCHAVERVADGVGYFDGNITSSNYVITKDGNKLTDGQGKIFIPWYAEDSTTKNPDEAAKIYHWNSNGGSTTWTLPKSWNNVTTAYLYKTTQTGKVLVDTLNVTDDHQITINADARSSYVVYPAEAEADVTEWSVGMQIGMQGDHVTMRTSPATMRMVPNTEYTVEFDTLGNSGTIYVQSESESSDKLLQESFQTGHSKFTFTTGDKND